MIHLIVIISKIISGFFLSEMLQAIREWNDMFKVLGENNLTTILYLTILFFKNEENERQSQTKAEGVQ